MKDQLQKKEHNGITYVEIPVTNDAKCIKATVERIKEVIKTNGSYQIFFVVELQSQKFREEDLLAIQSILENTKNITSYSVIVNKLPKCILEEMRRDERLKFAFPDREKMQPGSPLLLGEYLLDARNKFMKLEELEEFVATTPYINVVPVGDTDKSGKDV